MIGGKLRRRAALVWLVLLLSVIAASVGCGPASSDRDGLNGSPVPEAASSDQEEFEDSGGAAASSSQQSSPMPDLPPPQIDDPVSDAELRDLRFIAERKGITLQEAIDQYAWRDNFSLAAQRIRESFPEAFAGAEIVDGANAWIEFNGAAPQEALEVLDTFRDSHYGVSVEVRADASFTAKELERGVPAVHYAVLERPEVRNATTSYDSTTGKITTRVVLEDAAPDALLDDLRVIAEQSLIDATMEDILDSIGVSVVRSAHPVLGGD
ncbi:MAG: hypothetical protein ACOC5M_00715 [Chloroflexota bacterium]